MAIDVAKIPLGAYVADVFAHRCGEPIGVSDHGGPGGRPIFLAYDHDDPTPAFGGTPFKRQLWPLGSGEAGLSEQRCPGCGEVLELPDEIPGPAGEQLGLEI